MNFPKIFRIARKILLIVVVIVVGAFFLLNAYLNARLYVYRLVVPGIGEDLKWEDAEVGTWQE